MQCSLEQYSVHIAIILQQHLFEQPAQGWSDLKSHEKMLSDDTYIILFEQPA